MQANEGWIQDFPLRAPTLVRGGGGGAPTPMRVLFDENVCKNERIGSGSWGRRNLLYVDPPMQIIFQMT